MVACVRVRMLGQFTNRRPLQGKGRKDQGLGGAKYNEATQNRHEFFPNPLSAVGFAALVDLLVDRVMHPLYPLSG